MVVLLSFLEMPGRRRVGCAIATSATNCVGPSGAARPLGGCHHQPSPAAARTQSAGGFRRLAALSKPELGVAAAGALGASVLGLAMPVFAIAFSSLISVSTAVGLGLPALLVGPS
jgi:hypothetical protein